LQNSILIAAQNFLSENKFQEAITSLYELAYDGGMSCDDRVAAYKELIRIHELVVSDKKIIAQTMIDLAIVFKETKNYFEARDYLQKAKCYITRDDHALYGGCLLNIVDCLVRLNQIDRYTDTIFDYLDFLALRRKSKQGIKTLRFISATENVNAKNIYKKYSCIFLSQEECFDKVAEMLDDEETPAWWSLIEKEVLGTDIAELYRIVFLYHAINYRKKLLESISVVSGQYVVSLCQEMYHYAFEGVACFPNDQKLSKLVAELLSEQRYISLKRSLQSVSEVAVHTSHKVQKDIVSIVDQVIREDDASLVTRDAHDIALEKYVEYMSERTLIESYRDIIVSLVMLESYTAALGVIARLEPLLVGDEDVALLAYLKVVVLYRGGNAREAMSLIDFACKERSMREHSIADLMYIKAEILKNFGKNREALQVYKEILKSKDHRLVRQRIKEIERR